MSEVSRPRRSLLYVPASNAKALIKARTLPCDGVILDLEDAVAPELKDVARATALQLISERAFGERELIVRVNGHDTPWGQADVEALATAGPDAVLVPKVNGAADILRYDSWLASAPARTKLWAMVETARSFTRLDEIGATSATTRLAAWVIGTNDLAKEMRAPLDARREPFLAALSWAVIAVRAHKLSILDGVFNELQNAEGFAAQCRQAAAFGFDGKTLIHPNQIETCNTAFMPNVEELEVARAIIEAFARPENYDKGAISVNGQMAERLHLANAQRLIALSEQFNN